MQVHVTSGNYSIIASGEVFLFNPYEDLKIKIDDGDEFQLSIVMKFTEDSSVKYDIKTDVEDDSLVINCINFNSIGTGLKRPAHIADADEKKVYFMFSSSYLGDTNEKARSVKYTVFWENKVKE